MRSGGGGAVRRLPAGAKRIIDALNWIIDWIQTSSLFSSNLIFHQATELSAAFRCGTRSIGVKGLKWSRQKNIPKWMKRAITGNLLNFSGSEGNFPQVGFGWICLQAMMMREKVVVKHVVIKLRWWTNLRMGTTQIWVTACFRWMWRRRRECLWNANDTGCNL